MLTGQVVALAAVGFDVEELPAIGVEMTPAGRCCGGDVMGEPAVVPDPASAQHGVKLSLFAGVGRRIGKGCFETHTVQRLLRDTLHGFRRLDVQQVVDGRGELAYVDVVVPDLTVRSNCVGPRDNCGVGDPALVRGVPLVELVGRVESHRPTDRIMVVGMRPTEMVEYLHALFDGVDVAVEELALIHRSVRTALTTGAVVGD